MNQPPPLIRDQKKIDADHLKLLAIFHFVLAGFAILGLGFLLIHYTMFHMFMDNPEMWNNQENSGPPPDQFFAIFKWFYLFMGTFIVIWGVANLLSGLFLRKMRNRTFSLIVAGMNCIQFPLGTALGVFTFIVLLRDSVRDSYETS